MALRIVMLRSNFLVDYRTDVSTCHCQTTTAMETTWHSECYTGIKTEIIDRYNNLSTNFHNIANLFKFLQIFRNWCHDFSKKTSELINPRKRSLSSLISPINVHLDFFHFQSNCRLCSTNTSRIFFLTKVNKRAALIKTTISNTTLRLLYCCSYAGFYYCPGWNNFDIKYCLIICRYHVAV